MPLRSGSRLRGNTRCTQPLSVRHCRRGLDNRSCCLENRSSVTRARGVDSLAIDCLLYSLCFAAFQYHVAIPAFGVDRTPRAQVKHSDVPVNLERQQRFAQQITDDVMPSKAAHWPGMLAGHHRCVPAIDQQARRVAGGELGSQALQLQTLINWQSAEPVVRDRKARAQGMRPHATTPDDCGGIDLFASNAPSLSTESRVLPARASTWRLVRASSMTLRAS